jgi:monofunctional biosynthetic peptidoglycan transglycosylase
LSRSGDILAHRKSRPKRRRSDPLDPLRWLMRFVMGALIAGIVVSVAAVALLRIVAPPWTAVMLLEPGSVAALEHAWVDAERMSAAAARAVIAAEDQKFLTHRGFDFDSIGAALDDYRAGGGLRGASTITQQVAKNLFLSNGRSFVRKGLEAWFALLIEALWPKRRILEMYLNVAQFGPDVFGVEAAAQRYFGVAASELTPAQAALLAAVLPSPRRFDAAGPSEYVRERQAWVLAQMTLLERRGHYRGLSW